MYFNINTFDAAQILDFFTPFLKGGWGDSVFDFDFDFDLLVIPHWMRNPGFLILILILFLILFSPPFSKGAGGIFILFLFLNINE